MIINSFLFCLVFPVIFLLYWLIPNKLAKIRKWFLLVTSIVFYGMFSMRFLLVLIFIIAGSYLAAFCVSRPGERKWKKSVIWLTGGGHFITIALL